VTDGIRYKDGDFVIDIVNVPLVAHACRACILLAQRPGGDLQEGIQEGN
jgi:hypothetical protein